MVTYVFISQSQINMSTTHSSCSTVYCIDVWSTEHYTERRTRRIFWSCESRRRSDGQVASAQPCDAITWKPTIYITSTWCRWPTYYNYSVLGPVCASVDNMILAWKKNHTFCCFVGKLLLVMVLYGPSSKIKWNDDIHHLNNRYRIIFNRLGSGSVYVISSVVLRLIMI